MDGVDEKESADKDQSLIKIPFSENFSVLVNHHEEGDFHNIEDAVHDDSEPEVEAVLEGSAEGKRQELPVQPQVAHQIPTPVYLRVPLRQTGISSSRKKPHQIRQETIPVIHSSIPTFPSSTSVGNSKR